MRGTQILVAQPQLDGAKPREIGYEHVRGTQQPGQALAVLGRRQVQYDATLIGVEVYEPAAGLDVGPVFWEGPEESSWVALRRLHLDDVRPEVAEGLRAKSARNSATVLDNREIGQRSTGQTVTPANTAALYSSAESGYKTQSCPRSAA